MPNGLMRPRLGLAGIALQLRRGIVSCSSTARVLCQVETSRFPLPPAAEEPRESCSRRSGPCCCSLRRLSVTAADVLSGGQSVETRWPPQAFIIQAGTQVSSTKVSQRTGATPRSLWLSQVENPPLHPPFLPLFHHRGQTEARRLSEAVAGLPRTSPAARLQIHLESLQSKRVIRWSQ